MATKVKLAKGASNAMGPKRATVRATTAKAKGPPKASKGARARPDGSQASSASRAPETEPGILEYHALLATRSVTGWSRAPEPSLNFLLLGELADLNLAAPDAVRIFCSRWCHGMRAGTDGERQVAMLKTAQQVLRHVAMATRGGEVDWVNLEKLGVELLDARTAVEARRAYVVEFLKKHLFKGSDYLNDEGHFRALEPDVEWDDVQPDIYWFVSSGPTFETFRAALMNAAPEFKALESELVEQVAQRAGWPHAANGVRIEWTYAAAWLSLEVGAFGDERRKNESEASARRRVAMAFRKAVRLHGKRLQARRAPEPLRPDS